MTGKDMVGLVITSVLGLAMVVMAVFLLLGKGSFLIAGYNTLPPEEQEKYDREALCRFMGKILLPIGLSTPAVAIGGICNIRWVGWAYTAFVTALAIFALIYCNTGNRFKR